ncbi:hypothetical protein P4O66_001709 [Electrophorus voltai]|uniref:Uncharacterized protein n=1 Tax=Electrophorus voltai TaxID=2609070 RepID=A0AAD9DUA1_9TELE|nr:hypothetical protein P4O66_001709 [Electrophorus voltai]
MLILLPGFISTPSALAGRRPDEGLKENRWRNSPDLRDTGLLLYTLGLFTIFSLVAPQGSFPKLENIGAHKPVSVMPPGATCGVPKHSAFCWPAQIPEDLLTCSQRFCIQDCPYRSSTPHYTDLLAARLGGCPAGDSQDLHPGAAGGSTSFAFRNQSSCLASFSSLTLGPDGSFTLTLWVKLEEAAVMTVFEKSTMDRLVFLLRVSEAEVQLHYGVQDGHTVSITMSTAGRMTVGRWAHLALQIISVREN